MDFNNIKKLLILTIGSMFCWNISTAIYVNPHLQLPPHEHSKGAPTTVCVEIKPNGVESHNPYYMCNRPQFQTRQLNMPTLVQSANKENYPNYMPQQLINPPTLVNAYQQQQLPLNGQNYPYYRPQQAQQHYTGINTIDGNHQNLQNRHVQQYPPPLAVTPMPGINSQNYPYHAYQKPSGINLNSRNNQYAGYQQNYNILPVMTSNNGVQLNNQYNQHRRLTERNQQQTFADQSQPFIGTANLIKGNEEHYLNFQPRQQQQSTVTKTTNYENHQQQPLNTAGVIKVNEENKLNYAQQQISQAQNGNNPQTAQHASLQTNEPLKNFFNHNKERTQQVVTDPSNTEAIPEKSIRATTSLKEASLSHANTKQQEDLKENPKPPLNREQYQALIQDEVLGVPNLAFSPEEMLPIQQLFRGNLPQNVYNARIPPEHINDPILRNFYNINQKPEVLSQQNCNDCRFNNPQPRMEPYLTQLHIPAYNNVMKYPPNLYMDPNCVDCRPYTMQPILLAIPLFGSQVEDYSFPSAQHARAQPCGYSNGHVMHVNKDEQPQPKAIENEQPRLNPNNSSEESKTTLPTTSTPSLLSTTLSSEEDLFKEDSIENIEETKNENNNKKQSTVADDVNSKKAVDNVRSTTSQPPTTAPVTTFKTIMHAAKMMAKLPLFHHNKRQANYDDGELSTYFKKQYLTELKKENSDEEK